MCESCFSRCLQVVVRPQSRARQTLLSTREGGYALTSQPTYLPFNRGLCDVTDDIPQHELPFRKCHADAFHTVPILPELFCSTAVGGTVCFCLLLHGPALRVKPCVTAQKLWGSLAIHQSSIVHVAPLCALWTFCCLSEQLVTLPHPKQYCPALGSAACHLVKRKSTCIACVWAWRLPTSPLAASCGGCLSFVGQNRLHATRELASPLHTRPLSN